MATDTKRPVALTIEEFQTADQNLITATERLAQLNGQMDLVQGEASTAEAELVALQARHQQELVNVQRKVDDRHLAVQEMSVQIGEASGQVKTAREQRDIARAALKEAVGIDD